MPGPRAATAAGIESVALGFKSIVQSMMMEADEKCEEIDVRCEEEYQVLRKKEISEQGEIIEKALTKRREAVLRDDRVCYTKYVSNFRLAQLKAKNDIYSEILATIKKRIAADTSGRYQKLLENSLIQAMYMLMEPQIFVTCRKTDQSRISPTFPTVVHTYEKNTKLRAVIGFSNRSLPDTSSSGGMIVSNQSETITVDCSLNSRVDQVCYLAMPMIVEMLFSGVPMMKDPPKLSLQKALTPDGLTGDQVDERQGIRKKSEHSETPPTQTLLQERLGIGTSSINIHANSHPVADDEVSDDHQHHSGRGSTNITPESSELKPDSKRKSASNATRKPDQGPSSKER